ncbi:MAG TPA: hypothetical protein VFQ25_12905 [Ktedonobacterales bacterium]|nr:hypothetical protein [Ktedonobacterales bacterium]
MSTDGHSEESFAVPPPPPPPPSGSTPPGLPPLYPTPPGSTPPRPPAPRSDFFLGLFIGAIPLIFAMIGLGGVFNLASGLGNLLAVGGILYLVAWVLCIILIIVGRTRQVGIGMLTSLLSSPVIFFISCVAVLTHPFPAGGTST